MAEETKETKEAIVDKKADEKGTAPVKKLELTEAELKAHVESALKSERDASAAKQKEKDEADARKKSEEQGEFRKIADEEKAKREQAEAKVSAAELRTRTLEVKDNLRDYVAEKHPAYANAVKYMLPLVTFDLDTKNDAITESIKTIADQYVKDNPRTSGHGAPAAPVGRVPTGTVEVKKDPDNGQIPMSLEARRAF